MYHTHPMQATSNEAKSPVAMACDLRHEVRGTITNSLTNMEYEQLIERARIRDNAEWEIWDSSYWPHALTEEGGPSWNPEVSGIPIGVNVT